MKALVPSEGCAFGGIRHKYICLRTLVRQNTSQSNMMKAKKKKGVREKILEFIHPEGNRTHGADVSGFAEEGKADRSLAEGFLAHGR